MLNSLTRPGTWLALIAIGAGALVAVILGVHAFMTGTATPLHADPQSVPAVSDAEPGPRWSEAVTRARQAVRAGMVEQNLAGLSVAVGAAGGRVWAEGFGWADIEERVPVEPNLPFRIGTASVALTSAAAGLLVEKGELKLDDEIQAYVPAFPQQAQPVTVRQLMAHVAGIRNDGGDEGPLFSQHCERPADALPAFAGRALLFEPGAEFRYSSYGWILVSAAIEAAAREPFLRFMRKEIFEPLAMDHTRADAATESGRDRAASYFPRYAANPRYGLDPMRDLDYSCYAGASVFVSTASDMVRFALAVEDGTLLQPSTVKMLQTSLRLPSGQETGYGLGWDLETVTLAGQQVAAVGHDGDLLGGTVASLMLLPDRGMAVAVIANTSYADTLTLATKIAEAFAPGANRPER